jgi:hypothetical protein
VSDDMSVLRRKILMNEQVIHNSTAPISKACVVASVAGRVRASSRNIHHIKQRGRGRGAAGGEAAFDRGEASPGEPRRRGVGLRAKRAYNRRGARCLTYVVKLPAEPRFLRRLFRDSSERAA